MKKWVLRTVLGVVVLLIVIVVVAVVMIDRIAKAGIERGGSYAMGVDTRVQSVDLSLLGGQFTMDGLNVANPAGYRSPHVMHSGKFDLKLDPGTILSDTVVINSFLLDGLDLNIERTMSGSNVQTILDNLKRLGAEQPGKEPAPEEKEKGGKKVKVDDIVIRDVTATFHMLAESPLPPVTVRIPELHLENVAPGEGDGVTVARLMAKLVTAIMAGVLEQAKGAGLPTEYLSDLQGQLSQTVGALGGKTDELVQQASQEAGKAVGEAAKKAEEELRRGVTEGLGGLLGGKKEQQTQPAKP